MLYLYSFIFLFYPISQSFSHTKNNKSADQPVLLNLMQKESNLLRQRTVKAFVASDSKNTLLHEIVVVPVGVAKLSLTEVLHRNGVRGMRFAQGKVIMVALCYSLVGYEGYR